MKLQLKNPGGTKWSAGALALLLSCIPAGGCGGADSGAQYSPAPAVDAAGSDSHPSDSQDSGGSDEAAPADDAATDTGLPDGTTDPASIADYESACVRLHGCLGIDGVRQCLLNAHAHASASADQRAFAVAMQSIVIPGAEVPGTPQTLYLPGVIDCVRLAPDCPSVRACVGGLPCDPQSASPSCDGALLQHCMAIPGGGIVANVDCGSVGLACVTTDTPMGTVGQCADGPCGIGTPPACEGGVAANCFLGGWVRLPCDSMPGTQCALGHEMGMDMAQCQGGGDDCDMSHVPACDGTDSIVCQGGKLYSMSCPEGGECGTDPESGAGVCWASTLFCGPEACDGTTLTYCLEGEPRAVDCPGHGFAACAVGESGARCVP